VIDESWRNGSILCYDEYTRRASKITIGYLNCNFSENKNIFVNFKMFKIFGGQDEIKRANKKFK